MNLGPNLKLGKYIVDNYESGKQWVQEFTDNYQPDKNSQINPFMISVPDYETGGVKHIAQPIVVHNPEQPLNPPKTQKQLIWEYLDYGYHNTSQVMGNAYHSMSEIVAKCWEAIREYYVTNYHRNPAEMKGRCCWECGYELPYLDEDKGDSNNTIEAFKSKYCDDCWKNYMQEAVHDICRSIIFGDGS